MSSSVSSTMIVLHFGSFGFGSFNFGSFGFFKVSLAAPLGHAGSILLSDGSRLSHSTISNDGGFFSGQSRYHAQVS